MSDATNLKSNSLDAASDISEQVHIRMGKLDALRQAGHDPFAQTKFDVTHHAGEIIDNFEALEQTHIRVAGRLMSKRGMGKVSFCDLLDKSGKIQIFTKIDAVGEDAYHSWQTLDIGDIVGVEGDVFRTQKGEISIRNASFVLLAKALRPLPEKFHGLKDTETRYRQRYLDLIVNPDVRDVFIKRSAIIASMRKQMDAKGFFEVETPILNPIAGGAAARPFSTHHHALNMDMFLRIAPELYLKRLIVGGFERVYEMGRLFRNEGISIKHNPEFTLIEIYQAYTDMEGMIRLCEDLISGVADEVFEKTTFSYQGKEISLKPPFARMTMKEAVQKETGIDFSKVKDDAAAQKLAREQQLDADAGLRKGEILALFFAVYCECKLIQPTFICDYPVEVSPLAKRRSDDPEVTERFELFIDGREYANAYSELNDPIDQRTRFLDQVALREKGDEEASAHDEDFCVSLEYGMPPTGGMGIGIDRLVMLLTDQASIRDVLLFPTMRPLGQRSSQGDESDEKSKTDA